MWRRRWRARCSQFPPAAWCANRAAADPLPNLKTRNEHPGIQEHARTTPEHALTFVLPDGDRIPAHAHITEVGRIDKRFIDCGGTIRSLANCTLQAWVAED